MTTTDVITRGTHCPRPSCAGSYATVHAALLAVTHLAERGVPVERLLVVPADFRIPDEWLERTRRRARPLRSLAAGLIAIATSIVIVALTSILTLFVVAAALCVGGVTTAVTAWIDRWYAERVRRRAQSTRTVTAGRFDVVCTAAPERAAHFLAQWWDPQAPPVDPGRGTTVKVDEAMIGRGLLAAA